MKFELSIVGLNILQIVKLHVAPTGFRVKSVFTRDEVRILYKLTDSDVTELVPCAPHSSGPMVATPPESKDVDEDKEVKTTHIVNRHTIRFARKYMTAVARHFGTNVVHSAVLRYVDTVLTAQTVADDWTVINNTNVQDVVTMTNLKLKDYQSETITFALQNKRVILSLEMGLGKTLCSIVIASVLQKQLAIKHPNDTFRALVVCPASLRNNWCNEIAKFCSNLSTVAITSGKQLHLVGTVNITIIGYALMAAHIDMLARQSKYHLVVADEAHAVKHAKSKRAKAFTRLTKVTPRVVLLTGTPAQRHSSMWNLLKQLDPVLFQHFHHYQPKLVKHSASTASGKLYFGERYCVPNVTYVSRGRQTVVFGQSRRHDELRFITTKRCIRFTKDKLDLPPLSVENIVIGGLGKRLAKKFNVELARIRSMRDSVGSKAADAALMSIVRKTSALKIPFVTKYIDDTIVKDIQDEDDDVRDPPIYIVFTATLNMQAALAELLEQRNVPFIMINGDVSMTVRPDLLNKLSTGKARIGLLSLQTCSTGLNLTFASMTIFAELCFDSILLEQATCRTHRIGQTADRVVLRYLQLDGSTDALVWQNLRNKSRTSSMLLDGVDVAPVYDDANTHVFSKRKTREDEEDEEEKEAQVNNNKRRRLDNDCETNDNEFAVLAAPPGM